MIDINNRTFIYDAFIRGNLLYLVSHYCSVKDLPVSVYVNGIKATEIGYNEYEPVRIFHTPAPTTEEVVVTICDDEYKIKARRIIERPANKIAISTLFKYDYSRIPEFVDFYRSQGVDDFYFYYNGDVNETSALLLNDLPSGAGIHYRQWNYKYWNLDCEWKHGAQMPFLTTTRFQHMPDYKWFLLIDLDELIFHEKFDKLSNYLDTVDSNIDVIRIKNHWAKKTEKNKITYSSAHSPGWRRTKCIYRGTYPGFCGIHVPKNTEKMLQEPELVMMHIVDEISQPCQGKASEMDGVIFDREFYLK